MRSSWFCRASLAAAMMLSFTMTLSAEPRPYEEQEKPLSSEIAKAIKSKLVLHGTWASVKPDKTKTQHIVFLIVDSDPEVQMAQLEQLEQAVLAVGKILEVPFQVERPRSSKPDETPKPVKSKGSKSPAVVVKFEIMKQIPFKKFVKAVSHEVELTTELAGAALDDAYLGESKEVIPVGRIVNNNQQGLMINLCNSKFDELFGPEAETEESNNLVKAKPNPELRVKKPTGATAGYCFSLGRQFFTKQLYEEAYKSFTEAHLDAPGRQDVQYWRVLSLLGCGREADARRLLEGLVNANVQLSSVPKDTMVYHSLETVQGPLRWRLIAMERTLLCKTCN